MRPANFELYYIFLSDTLLDILYIYYIYIKFRFIVKISAATCPT